METLTSAQSHGAIFFLVMRDTNVWSAPAFLTASRKLNSITGMLRSSAFFIFESISFTLSFVLITAAILSVMREPTDPPSFLMSPSISSFERPSFESRTNFKPSNVGGRWEDDSDLEI